MSGNRFESWPETCRPRAKVAMLLSLFVVGVSGAWLPPGALRVSPESYTTLRTSGNSTLHQINLPANATYAAGPPLLISLVGDRFEIGRAYASLLGHETIEVFSKFLQVHGDGRAWVAWEDATPNRSKWRPAACNAYVRIDFDRFW